MTQERIDVPPAPDPPDLPTAPAYWPMVTSSYTPYRQQGRVHCTVCVRLVHSKAWKGGVPRPGHWVRRKAKGDRIDNPNTLILCHFHRRQYLNRDNEERVKAGLDPLSGGG